MTDNKTGIEKWILIAFINLMIVALLGVLLRYKIAYYFPFIDQQNFLHAHSNFAFSGWVTHALITLIVAYLKNYLPDNLLKKYKWILIANLIAAYGMLFSFLWEGYGIVSNSAAILAIIVSYVFSIILLRSCNPVFF